MTTALAAHRRIPWLSEDVQDWEEAGVRLESAIATFLHLSRKLEQSAKNHSIDSENLILRLNRRIEYFHTLLTQPLAESFACVARTKNTLFTPIHRLPSEILQTIFEFATTGPTSNRRFEPAIRTNCLCLYRIISVCSVWRKVGVAHAPLWRLVPLVCFEDRPRVISEKSVEYSLERAGNSDLHFVALMGEFRLDDSSPSWEILAENARRFRSVDIRASTLDALEDVLNPILATTTSGFITELSLSRDLFSSQHDDPDRLYLFQPPAGADLSDDWGQEREHPALLSILSQLRVLRLENVSPCMDNASLGNFVELRVYALDFGPETALRQFLRALSTASRLETLDISSVSTSEEALPAVVQNRSVSLPSLRTLDLGDLSFNVIRTVLSTIRPGPYRIILSLGYESLGPQGQDDQVNTGIEALKAAIYSHTLDTLVLTRSWFVHNGDENLRSILMTQPNITAIYVQYPAILSPFSEALTRPTLLPFLPNRFARLRRIYISCRLKDIPDHVAFKRMLTSHPLEELVLRRSRSKHEFPEFRYWDDADDDDEDGADAKAMELQSWLQENIPRLKLLERGSPCWLELGGWPLW